MLCKVMLLLMASKEGTFDSPRLPPPGGGGWGFLAYFCVRSIPLRDRALNLPSHLHNSNVGVGATICNTRALDNADVLCPFLSSSVFILD